MSVISFLEKHARDNVWCTPDQDAQYTFCPNRVSHPRGVLRSVQIGQDTYNLPNTTARFHVYQLGQMPADFLRIVPEFGTWRHISSVCQIQSMVIDLYTTNGVQYPRSQSWLLITPNKTVVIAVQDQPHIVPSLSTEPLYVRLYSNAFFTSDRRNDGNDYRITVYGRTISSLNDISDIAQMFNEANALVGYATATVNGYIVNTINSGNTALGDVVEFIYDATVEWVVEVPLSQLSSFTSTLDSKQKYLLTFNQALNVKDRSNTVPTVMTSSKIYFFDDNDIHLYRIRPNNVQKGVMYHRNQADAVRMLTHRDYSLPVTYVNSYVDNAGIFTNVSDINVRVLLRQSGYARPLVDESHRIQTLYTLADPNRPAIDGMYGVVDAMRGLESTVTEWRADSLENSDYTRVMRRYDQFITDNNIVSAYGYHGIAKVYGDTFCRVRSAIPASWNDSSVSHYVDLPPGAVTNSTIFLYTAGVNSATADSGVLTSSWYHTSGDQFFVPPQAWSNGWAPTSAEVLLGKGSDTLSMFAGRAIYTINTPNEYRCYKCPIGPFGPTWDWVDVTGTGDYTVEHNANNTDTVAFTIDTQFYFTAVKTSENFLLYNFTLPATESLLRFSVDAKYDNAGTIVNDVMHLPPGKLEIFAEGYKLIEGLDYYVNYPEVVISGAVAWRKVVDGSASTVTLTIRATGFCNPQMQRDIRQEAGFIANGVLSVDSRFEVRTSKVNRLFINGRLVDVSYIRSNSGYAQIQEDIGSHFVVAPSLTGLPFLFEDTIVPLPGLGDGRDALAMRETSLDLDRRLSDLFTAKYPQPLPTTPDVAASLYKLYSPFYFKVLSDLIAGIILPAVYDPAPTDTALKTALQPYEYLLPYDPCRKRDAWWLPNVVILGHPLTTMQLTIKQWAFMVRVNQIYLFNTINANSHVTIVG